ncbi:MAG: hypothetical protein WC449_05865 [Candidatus Paceibacterota bacterium]
MPYYGYTEQPKNYGHIAAAGTILGGAIQQLPAAQDAADKRKLLQSQLAQLKLDATKAEEVRLQRVAEAVVEYKETLGLKDDDVNDRLATKIEATFYSPAMGDERNNPEKAIMRWSDADSKFKDYINREAIKKYRSETQTREEQVIGGPAGRQVPWTVGVQDQGVRRMPQDLSTMQESALQEPRAVPAVSYTPNSQERRGIAGRMGISEEPEIKSNIQQTADVETGEAYQPGLNRAEYRSREGAAGRVGGLSKEIGDATPSEQQLLVNQLRADAEANKVRARDTYNNLKALDIGLTRDRMTADQRNKTISDRVSAQLRIEDLKKDSQKILADLDAIPDQYQNRDMAAIAKRKDQIQEMIEEQKYLELSIPLYDQLLKEQDKKKGGNVAGALPQPPVYSKQGFNQWLQNRGK